MLETQSTLIALRVTAFASSLSFAVHYALHSRKFWCGFVLFHLIHLGFILWLGFGLHHPFGAFTWVTGIFGYLVLVAMAGAETLRPGAIERYSIAVHFLWLNLIGTYAIQIAAAFARGTGGKRIHSFIAAAILLTSAAVRWRGWKNRADRPVVEASGEGEGYLPAGESFRRVNPKTSSGRKD